MRQRVFEDNYSMLEIMLDKVPILAAMIDTAETYMYVNQQFADFHRKPKSFFIGKKLSEILPESTYQRVKFPLEQVKSGETINFENSIKTAEGQVETFKVTYDPVVGSDGKVKAFVALMENITLQKETESELTNSVELIEKLLDVAPIGIILTDAEGFITYENPAMRKIMGVPEDIPSPVIGKNINKVQSMIDSGGVEIFNKIFRGDQVIQEQIEFTSLFGKHTILEAYGSVVYDRYKRRSGAIVLVIDITERILIQNKLMLSEEKFRKAFHLSPDAININRLEDGLFVEINHGFTRTTGFTSKDVTGKTSQDMNIWVNPKNRQKLVNGLKKHGRVNNMEAQFRTKKGNIVHGLMSAVIVEIEGASHILSITRNIDSFKKIQEELIDARNKAEESDRLKSAFLANISHEIRTPMNAILGFSDLIESENPTDEKKRLYFNIIRNNGETLLNLVDNLIDIAKIESGHIDIEPSPFEINKMLSDLYQTFMPIAEKKGLKIGFNIFCPDGQDQMVSDKMLIGQILSNLIDNAIKFTDNGEVRFGYRVEDGLIKFFVSDTGMGIPKEYYRAIFERFRRIKDISIQHIHGTGLGLTICKYYVNLLGGSIWVESRMGMGSNFYFTIPQSD